VLEGLNKSPYGFLVKALHVEPVPEAPAGPGVAPPPGPGAPNQPLPPPRPRRESFSGAGLPQRIPGNVATPAFGRVPAGGDRPVTLLKERRLRITLLIYAIRTTK